MESYVVYAKKKYAQTHSVCALLYDIYNSFHVINWDFYSRSHILTLDSLWKQFPKAQDF